MPARRPCATPCAPPCPRARSRCRRAPGSRWEPFRAKKVLLGGVGEGATDPAFVQLTGGAMLGREDTAGERVLASRVAVGVDIDTVDADRRRTEEAQPLR